MLILRKHLSLGWQSRFKYTLHLHDDGALSDRAHDVHEVPLVANENRKTNQFLGIVLFRHGNTNDRGVRLRDGGRDLREGRVQVRDADVDRDGEHGPGPRFTPFNRHPTLGVGRLTVHRVRTVRTVDAQTVTWTRKARDLVAWNRVATGGKLHGCTLVPLDLYGRKFLFGLHGLVALHVV